VQSWCPGGGGGVWRFLGLGSCARVVFVGSVCVWCGMWSVGKGGRVLCVVVLLFCCFVVLLFALRVYVRGVVWLVCM